MHLIAHGIRFWASIVISLTPVGAGIIGFWAYKVQRDKLKLDLYNRRFNIYNNSLELYYAIMGRYAESEIKEKRDSFVKSYRESKFLFNPKYKIYDVLGEMHNKSAMIFGYEDNREELRRSDPENNLQMARAVSDARLWFSEAALPTLEARMLESMGFHENPGWTTDLLADARRRLGVWRGIAVKWFGKVSPP